jgi:zinc transport system substrate-binding protein
MFAFWGCTQTTTASDKIKVAVSIVPEASFVQEIAGDLVEIVTVIPPGYSPGNYEPSSQFMEDLSDASVYFAIGVAAETASIIPLLSESDILIIHLDEIVSDAYSDRMFSGENRDPHIWLSLKRVIVMVNTIASTLSSLDPIHETTFQTNANTFIADLETADGSLTSAFSSVTKNQFIVFHPAYGYFADDYGLNMIAIEEDGKESTASHLAEVIDLAITNDIHTVFYQAEIDSSQVEAFAEEIQGVMVELDPLAQNYLENMVQMGSLILEALQ